jgi:hypothetical protein
MYNKKLTRSKISEADCLRRHLQLRIHLNHLLSFKEFKNQRLISLRKVEIYLSEKRRQKVIMSLKLKLDSSYRKETNIRK